MGLEQTVDLGERDKEVVATQVLGSVVEGAEAKCDVELQVRTSCPRGGLRV